MRRQNPAENFKRLKNCTGIILGDDQELVKAACANPEQLEVFEQFSATAARLSNLDAKKLPGVCKMLKTKLACLKSQLEEFGFIVTEDAYSYHVAVPRITVRQKSTAALLAVALGAYKAFNFGDIVGPGLDSEIDASEETPTQDADEADEPQPSNPPPKAFHFGRF